MTVRELIKSSLRLIGAIASGETPSADEFTDSLSALNGMLGSWSNQSLLINSKKREVFNLVSGQQAYTIGTGGNFNTVRPTTILGAAILKTGSDPFESPLDLINQQQWAEILNKDTAGSLSQKLYAEGTFPLETINLWPKPDASDQIVIYSQKPLTTFISANDEVSFPVGYDRALRYNLAVELAPEFGRQLSPEIMAIAIESKSEIKALNSESLYLVSDAIFMNSVGNTFNISTGQ